MAYLLSRYKVKTETSLRVAQSWHLGLMLLRGMRPGSMQGTPPPLRVHA